MKAIHIPVFGFAYFDGKSDFAQVIFCLDRLHREIWTATGHPESQAGAWSVIRRIAILLRKAHFSQALGV